MKFSFPTEAETESPVLGFGAAEQLTEACERITWSQMSRFFSELDASGLLDTEDRTDVQPVPQLSVPERLRLALSQLLTSRPSKVGADMTLLEDPRFTERFAGLGRYPIAGRPEFERNFTRDAILAALLADDLPLLRRQLEICRVWQGWNFSPATGEEYGKIHHEFPGVTMPNGMQTIFNACDTTSLFIVGMRRVLRSGTDPNSNPKRDSLGRALCYLFRHVVDDVFWEFPVEAVPKTQIGQGMPMKEEYAPDERFALDVTYWKDSRLPYGYSTKYPISYALAHFQAVTAFRAAADILTVYASGPMGGRQDIQLADTCRQTAARMIEAGLDLFWTDGGADFAVAATRSGRRHYVISSDEAHLLAYLSVNDTASLRERVDLRDIAARADVLATVAGTASTVGDQRGYHGDDAVWPWEQPFIQEGLTKHGIPADTTVQRRCLEYLTGDPEYLLVTADGDVIQRGCAPQLWTAALNARPEVFDLPFMP